MSNVTNKIIGTATKTSCWFNFLNQRFLTLPTRTPVPKDTGSGPVVCSYVISRSDGRCCLCIWPCSGKQGGAPPQGFFILLIIYTLKNFRNLCFHDFSWFLETNGMVPEFFAEFSYIGYHTTSFGQLTKLTFQCNFKCKTYLARYDHRYLICKESSYTMTLYEKNGSNTCMTFSTHKQKIPSKTSLFWCTLHKVCMICTFCCADTILLRKWLTTGIWKWKYSLVWKYRMSRVPGPH